MHARKEVQPFIPPFSHPRHSHTCHMHLTIQSLNYVQQTHTSTYPNSHLSPPQPFHPLFSLWRLVNIPKTTTTTTDTVHIEINSSIHQTFKCPSSSLLHKSRQSNRRLAGQRHQFPPFFGLSLCIIQGNEVMSFEITLFCSGRWDAVGEKLHS